MRIIEGVGFKVAGMSRGRFRDIAEEDRENRKLLGVLRSRENRKLLGVLRTSRSVLLTREAVLALETPIYFPIVIETPIYFRKMPSGQKASLVFEACGG